MDRSVAQSLLSATIASRYGGPLESVGSAEVVAGHGIVGDRHAGGVRQVTLVCTGEVGKASAERGLDPMEPAATRRNVVVDLAELPRDHGSVISVGDRVGGVIRNRRSGASVKTGVKP